LENFPSNDFASFCFSIFLINNYSILTWSWSCGCWIYNYLCNPGDESTFSLFLAVYLFACLFVCFCFAFILGGVYACFASTYQSAQDPA
jgi:hypothetical protein